MSIINATSIPKNVETTANTTGGSARERAIAKFTQAQAQATPVLNPTNVAPEEMGAIAPAAQPSETPSEPAKADVAIESSTPGQTATTEAPKAATSQEPVSPQLAQLARKERAIRQQQVEMKAREAAIQAREDALKAPPAPDMSKYVPLEDLTKNPWDLLSKHGITYDQLTQQALNQPSAEQQALTSELAALRAEMKTLKDGQDGVKKSYEESQKQAYTQAVNQIRNEATQLVKNNPAFEAISHTNSVNEVVELIERTFREDGTLLTVEEAANEIENHLLEEAIKLAGMNKVKQRLNAAAPKAAPEKTPGETNPKQSQAKPTLTNAVGTTRPLTAKERAILAFKGELKK